jgi:DNA ligase-1
VRQVKLLLYNHCGESEREIYIKLLSKTLRLGVTAKTVNKVIPGLIPEWEVQQGFPIEKHPIPGGTKFWLTQKLNGVRATFYNGQLIARSGVPFKGLNHILKEIAWVQNAGFVLDGELTLKDKGTLSDNEAFRVATGILNSDDVNKTSICFTVFDAISVRDFESAEPKVQYANRRIVLNELADSFADAEYVSVLPVLYSGTDQTKINECLEQMVSEDKEGLMANLDVPYRRTRHKGILKIKRFYTMDLPILRCEEGTGRLEGTLGAFVLEYKGNEVKVGSGFTDEQRATYWQQRYSIAGTLCEVKYKEISSDKNTGLESLQFPVFVQLRTDKTEISYG